MAGCLFYSQTTVAISHRVALQPAARDAELPALCKEAAKGNKRGNEKLFFFLQPARVCIPRVVEAEGDGVTHEAAIGHLYHSQGHVVLE